MRDNARSWPDDGSKAPIATGPSAQQPERGSCRTEREGSAPRRGITHALLLGASSARDGLARGPVCNRVSVAERWTRCSPIFVHQL